MATLVQSPALTLADGRALAVHREEHTTTHEIALVVEEEHGTVVAVAVCDVEPDGTTAHANVTVDAAWQGQGIGRELVHRLVETAAEQGLTYLTARYPEADRAATRMLAGSGEVVARRTGDGIVRVAVFVPAA
jgi:GNAT superfamily N-acetyltransferase